MALFVGCVAGASQTKKYEDYLKQVGFEGMYTVVKRAFCAENSKFVVGVFIVDAKSNLNLHEWSLYLPQRSCCGGCGNKETTSDIAELDFDEWVG